MWILHFLPDSFIQFIVHTILVLGIVGCLLSFFVINRVLRFMPMLAPYYRAMQVISVLLLVGGIYLEGGYSTEMQWRARVAELEAKLKEAETQSAEVNSKLEKKSQERVKVIRGRTEYITRYIDKEIVKYDTKFMPGGVCEIPQEFIKAHNDAAAKPEKQ
jgi:hypothetical protein